MAEIKQDGYVSLRKTIVKNWKQFDLLDNEGKSVYSNELNENNWKHERQTKKVFIGNDHLGRPQYEDIEYESNQTLEYEVTITGGDLESLPTTVSSSTLSESYSVEGVLIKSVEESFDEFTFENENDQLTIKHKINVPAIN